ncbi:MAG: replication-relaxation family protein [Chloroflexi bacterium]|nr:replication-relaxation family protein [Chloroflexota bacterium]
MAEVLRWQQLTTRQIARWFFDSPRTATNRIAALEAMGYLRTIQLPWRAPALVTATPKGARARADLRLSPRRSEPGRLLHDLTVVEVAAWLLEQDQQAEWITERELVRDQLDRARGPDGRLRQGPGRRPDGVLVRSNSRLEAVEIELTPKRERTEYDRKLAWYTSQLDFSRLHWFVPSSTLRDRLRNVAQTLRMEDMIQIAPLPPDGCYPPGVIADRQRSHVPNR